MAQQELREKFALEKFQPTVPHAVTMMLAVSATVSDDYFRPRPLIEIHLRRHATISTRSRRVCCPD